MKRQKLKETKKIITDFQEPFFKPTIPLAIEH